MPIVILLFPLFSALVSGFFGRVLGSRGVSIFSTVSVFFSFFLSIYMFCEVVFLGKVSHFFVFPWISSGILFVNWGFLFDREFREFADVGALR